MEAVIGISELRELYAFTEWANRRILVATGALDEAQLGRDPGAAPVSADLIAFYREQGGTAVRTVSEGT